MHGYLIFFIMFYNSIFKGVKVSPVNMQPSKAYGSALGPDWALDLSMKGTADKSHNVTVENECELKRIITPKEYVREFPDSSDKEWPVYVELTNKKVYGCDFIVSATGVKPAVDVFTQNNAFEIATDGGLVVNDKMQTSIKDIYAAGDVCTASWAFSPHWSQMRLWDQALQMGDYAARSMWASYTNQRIELDFCFELFAHITSFFNFKVILLGNYNAKGLDRSEYELLIRCTESMTAFFFLHFSMCLKVLLIYFCI